MPRRVAPRPRVTASPTGRISLWQTPWAHTVLPVVAGSLWGAGSAPPRRAASSHPQCHGRTVTAEGAGGGQVWVKVCQRRGLNAWCQGGNMKEGWWRKFLLRPAEVQIPPQTRSEQLLVACLAPLLLSPASSASSSLGGSPAPLGPGCQERGTDGLPAALC